MPTVQLPARVPREYTLKINKELKEIKVPITDPREEALEILRKQILRLYDGGKTIQEILDLINSGMVIAKNTDIIRIIETRDDIPVEIAQDDKPRAKRKSKRSKQETVREDSGSTEGASRDDRGSDEGARRDDRGSDEGAPRDARGSDEGAPRDDSGSDEGAPRDDRGSDKGAPREDRGSEQGMAGAARDAPVEKHTAGTFVVKPDREIL